MWPQGVGRCRRCDVMCCAVLDDAVLGVGEDDGADVSRVACELPREFRRMLPAKLPRGGRGVAMGGEQQREHAEDAADGDADDGAERLDIYMHARW